MNDANSHAKASRLIQIGLAAALLFGSFAAQAAFKCKDDKGVTHYYDTAPPPQCESKPVTEMNKSGRATRTLDPSLTPEQAKQRAEEAERKRIEDKKNAEQNRKDRALLSTYSSEKEFDVSRDKQLAQVETRIQTADQRIKDLEKQQKKLDGELEFYTSGKSKKDNGKDSGKDAKDGGKSKGAPQHLTEELERTKAERNTLASNLKRMNDEKKQINDQFDADKQRWRDLKQGKIILVAEPAPAAAIKRAGEKGSLICNNAQHDCKIGYIYSCRGVDDKGNFQVTMMTCK